MGTNSATTSERTISISTDGRRRWARSSRASRNKALSRSPPPPPSLSPQLPDRPSLSNRDPQQQQVATSTAIANSNSSTLNTAVLTIPLRDQSQRSVGQNPTMSAVRRLLTGAQSDSSSKVRSTKALAKQQQQQQQQHPPPSAPPPFDECVAAPNPKIHDIEHQIVLLRDLSIRIGPDSSSDRLEACVKGDYANFSGLFQTACEVQPIIGTASNRDRSMIHLQAERVTAMGITLYGTEAVVTIISNGAGVLFVLERESVVSLLFEGFHFDISSGEDTPIDLILKAMIEMKADSDVDDLKAILSSIRFCKNSEELDAIDEINRGGLDISSLKLIRPEFYTTRVLAMMTTTEVYEQGFFKKYVHTDRLGNAFSAVREGETCSLSTLSVMPEALNRTVKNEADVLGEDLFMARRKGRKDKFRLTCSVSVNVWEEYETPEWFGYIHPPPNADAVRPADLSQLKTRLEAYGVPDGSEVCRLVYHCLGHKSRNSNVKVDTLSAARSYFMYLKNFLKHGTTGTGVNHIVEGDELAVVYDGIAYRVSAPQTELRHKSLFQSLVISDERERNGKNVAKRSVIRRMCSTSEVVLSLCKEITYLNAEYDEDGGTLYSASAEEENLAEAWATCSALFVCDGYGCLEGCFNCAIENRRGAIVDEMAVFMNDVQVPVVFDKLYRKTSIAEELSTMSDARGATYPGAFISGRDQCNERTFLAGSSHRLSRSSLLRVLQRELRMEDKTVWSVVAHVEPAHEASVCEDGEWSQATLYLRNTLNTGAGKKLTTPLLTE